MLFSATVTKGVLLRTPSPIEEPVGTFPRLERSRQRPVTPYSAI